MELDRIVLCKVNLEEMYNNAEETRCVAVNKKGRIASFARKFSYLGSTIDF